MGQNAGLIIGIAGAVIGGIYGGPAGAEAGSQAGFSLAGAAQGFAIGSAIGSAAFPAKKPNDYKVQQQIDTLKLVGTDYGQCIPYLRGSVATAGQDWWHSDKRPITSWAVSGGGGGKGSGGGGQTFTQTITYKIDMLIGLADNQCAGLARIWEDGVLIYNASSDASINTLAASSLTGHWDRLQFYDGNPSQLPDPTYEAAVETANAQAYRGRSSVFIEGWNLGTDGNIRNLVFEVVADGSASGDIYPWILQTGAVNSHWTGITRGMGLYVAVAQDGGSPTTIMTSQDGITWGLTAASPMDICAAIAFGNQRFVAVSNGGGTSGVVMYSDDSQNWFSTGVTPLIAANVSLNSIAFGNGVFVAVGSYYAFVYGVVFVSATGVGWSAEDSAAIQSKGWNAVAYGAGLFVAVGTSGVMVSADNGATWTLGTIPAGTYVAITYSEDDNRFIAVGGNLVATSPDGINWTARTPAASKTFTAVAAGNGRIVAVAFDADATSAMVSNDAGVTWSIMATPARHWQAICYGNSQFVAVAYGGGSQDVMTSLAVDYDIITKSSPSFADVVSDIHLRCGLTAGQFDVTDLVSISDKVDSLNWDQVSSGRSVLELLETVGYFEKTESDKLYYRRRGQATVAAIPYADLGAYSGDGEPPEPLALQISNDIEIPARISLTCPNVDGDYQPMTVMSDRLVTATSETVEQITISIGMTPARAQGVVETIARDRDASNVSSTINLLGHYARLEPTDRITATGPDGSTYTIRLVEKTDEYPLLTFKVVIDDAAALVSEGITNEDYNSTTTVDMPAETLMKLLDIPILQDSDNDAGYYVATKGSSTPYPGAAIFTSADGVTFDLKTFVDESAVFGVATTALGNWSGGWIFDWVNKITVNVGAGELSSSTHDLLLNSLTVNAMLIGDEIIQFINATLVSPGIYTLSGLLRGQRGTEWAISTHIAGDRVVLLQTSGIRRIAVDNSDIGVLRYVKSVTRGRAISSADSQSFTDNAVGLRPFAPIYAKVTRDASHNVTFTAQRRTRLGVRMIGSAGINVPLGEDEENYRIKIYTDSGYTTVKRTIEVSGDPIASYSAADQTTDFGSAQATIYHKWFMVSGVVGEGIALVAAA